MKPSDGVSPSQGECRDRSEYQNRWPDKVNGGPTIGPVTLAVGTGQPLPSIPLGTKYRTKLPVIVDAQIGDSITLRALPGPTQAALAYEGVSPDDAKASQSFSLPEGSFGGSPIDIPGVVIFSTTGCLQLEVTLNGASYTFAVPLVAADRS